MSTGQRPARFRPGDAHDPPTDMAAANTLTVQSASDGEIDQELAKASPRPGRRDAFVFEGSSRYVRKGCRMQVFTDSFVPIEVGEWWFGAQLCPACDTH